MISDDRRRGTVIFVAVAFAHYTPPLPIIPGLLLGSPTRGAALTRDGIRERHEMHGIRVGFY